ncbi:MAG: BtpA/SgcQ family protein [Minisyncoccia bacterium]
MEIAFEAGADGIFLIGHKMDTDRLLEIYGSVRKLYPEFWIGLNLLRNSAGTAIRLLPANADGLWTDDAGVREEYQSAGELLKQNWHWWKQNAPIDALYFGGVAFKYQRPVHDEAMVARLGTEFMDVVTTSGDRTGEPPNIHKIAVMKTAIGTQDLAIASGISAENVRDFLPYVSAFLVASAISKNFDVLDATKVRELEQLIHSDIP